MKDRYESHTHCLCCEKPYPTKEEAEACFWSHSEIELLRWVAQEASYVASYSAELNKRVADIVERFSVDNIEDLLDYKENN